MCKLTHALIYPSDDLDIICEAVAFNYHSFDVGPHCVKISWLCNFHRPVTFTLETFEEGGVNRISLNSTSPTFNFPRSVFENEVYFGLSSGRTICNPTSVKEYYGFKMLLDDGMMISSF